LAFTFLGAGTLYFIKKPKFSKYCVVEKGISKEKLSMFEVFKVMFIINHPYLNTFMLNASPISKKFRTFIFYVRILMMMTIISILGSNSGFSFGERVLEDI